MLTSLTGMQIICNLKRHDSGKLFLLGARVINVPVSTSSSQIPASPVLATPPVGNKRARFMI